MKYEEFFNKYKRDLLWMVNTDAGRYLLGLKDKEKIIHVTPNSFHTKIDKNKYVGKFFTYNRVAEIFLPLITKLEIANEYRPIDPYKAMLHYSGLEHSSKYPSIFLITSTFGSPPSGFGINSSSAVYATAHSGSGFGLDGGNTNTIENVLSGVTYVIQRLMVSIDTTALPDSFIIDTGANSNFLRLPGAGTKADDGQSISVVSNSMAGDSPAADQTSWDATGTTAFGSKTLTAWVNSGNNDISLDSNGRAVVSATGKTKLGCKTSGDISTTTPGDPGGKAQFDLPTVLLSITYSVGHTLSTNTKFW